MRMMPLAALVAAALSLSGCLRKDSTHTLYLSPDGAVRWTAVEADVYSDEEDPAKRFEEEQAYIGAALIGAHPVAAGLNALRPDSFIDTRVLRDEPPFHVMTETRFFRIDRLVQQVLNEFGAAGRTSLRFEHGRMVLQVVLDFSRPNRPSTSPAIRMAEEADRLRIVLTDGRFGPSVGFDVVDRKSATLADEWMTAAQSAFDRRTTIELMLSWGDADSR